ncbi:MAG: 50S ribosomal protein L11 methyltransferase [Pyrinomonadaceae bacterium]
MDKKQENWYSVEIETKQGTEEAVEFALNELDSLGNEINQFGKKQSENLSVIGYFNEKIDDAILQEKLDEGLKIYSFSNEAIKKIEWREIENRDWLAEWKKHWRPTETEQFIIAPIWSEVAGTEKIIIRIEPSMAFGTGTHETTKLCLKAIEQSYQPGESFFDLGTGTGILAIAVTKKSQIENAECQIVGCDTDEDSIKIAEENAELNKTESIEFFVGSISPETPEFDFVCANVTADVIVPLLPLLVEKAKRILVLSGILKEQESLIVKELKNFQIEKPRIKTDGEWISVTVENGK